MFTLQALASVPPLLVLLGDEEAGLLLGAWAESRGVALSREVNPTTERFRFGAYRTLREDRSEEDWQALLLRAAEYDEADLLALARRSIESSRK